MVLLTITLSFGMSIFSSPLLANTDNNNDSGSESRSKFLNIITVNKPQYEMVKEIVRDKHNVEYMLCNEKDINNFKYNQDIITNVSNMDLFIYSGANFEPWISSFIGELKKGNLGIINLSRGVRTLNYSTDNQGKENPYYFGGVEEYKIALYNVKAAVQDRDPQNRDYYEKNYNDAIENLDKQIKEYKEKLKSVKDYTFITLDENFDYFTKSLNLNCLKLDNHELTDFIKTNNLDSKKVIIIDDGENPTELNLSGYNTVKLWKYYGEMSFEELMIYNIGEVEKITNALTAAAEAEANESTTTESTINNTKSESAGNV